MRSLLGLTRRVNVSRFALLRTSHRRSVRTCPVGSNYVVVGGVAGGASTCARLRRICEDSNVIMFERGKYVSFANCGLPYYVGQVVKKESKLLVATPELFERRFRIDVRNETNVKKIDRERKVVIVESRHNGEYEQPYDKLVLAVGAAPIRPPIEGIDLAGVFSVRTIEDSRHIREYISQLPRNRNKCCIVGGGFIGLEMCENMVHRGFDTTVVDALPQVMGVVDPEMVVPFHKKLTEKGVTLELGEMLSSIEKGSDGLVVHTKNGKAIEADLVILGLGVLPENKLAAEAGLELGVRGSIAVNHRMQTSDADIFAVGDAVETYNCITGGKMNLALAGPAQQQARLTADVITGVAENDEEYRGVQGSSVCGVFGEVIASTGLSEKYLNAFAPELAKHAVHVYAHPGNHADFYPNAEKMHMKMSFDRRDGRVLGATCVGKESVVKPVDTIAAFIQMKATVDDLAHAELCYAPAYGSARGPVNIVGQMGLNIMKGLMDVYDWNCIRNEVSCADVILDVRESWETEVDPIQPKSDNVKVINISVDQLRDRHESELKQFKNDFTQISTLCHVGKRGYLAARFLQQMGYNTKLCSGGAITYHMMTDSFKYQNEYAKPKK